MGLLVRSLSQTPCEDEQRTGAHVTSLASCAAEPTRASATKSTQVVLAFDHVGNFQHVVDRFIIHVCHEDI